MRPVGQRDRGGRACDFFNRDRVCDIAHARAAEFFLDRHAQQTKAAHLFPERGREFVLGVDLGGHRFDPFLRPTVHHIAHLVHVIAQIEFHGGVEHRPLPRVY